MQPRLQARREACRDRMQTCHPKTPISGRTKDLHWLSQNDDRHHGTWGSDCKRAVTRRRRHGGCLTSIMRPDSHCWTSIAQFALRRLPHQTDHHRDIANHLCQLPQKDDSHKGDYGDRCETCHRADDWKKGRFDHNKLTKFSLAGGAPPRVRQVPHRTDLAETGNLPSCHQRRRCAQG